MTQAVNNPANEYSMCMARYHDMVIISLTTITAFRSWFFRQSRSWNHLCIWGCIILTGPLWFICCYEPYMRLEVEYSLWTRLDVRGDRKSVV